MTKSFEAAYYQLLSLCMDSSPTFDRTMAKGLLAVCNGYGRYETSYILLSHNRNEMMLHDGVAALIMRNIPFDQFKVRFRAKMVMRSADLSPVEEAMIDLLLNYITYRDLLDKAFYCGGYQGNDGEMPTDDPFWGVLKTIDNAHDGLACNTIIADILQTIADGCEVSSVSDAHSSAHT